jgi:hypothetical protein
MHENATSAAVGVKDFRYIFSVCPMEFRPVTTCAIPEVYSESPKLVDRLNLIPSKRIRNKSRHPILKIRPIKRWTSYCICMAALSQSSRSSQFIQLMLLAI